MPKTTYAKILLLILVVTTTSLQGCNVSQDAGTAADNPAAVRLALDSLSGSTTLMADGESSVPLQLSVIDGSGQGVANIPVTFSTTAGLLSASTGTTAARAQARAASEPTSTTTSMTGSNGTAKVVLTSSTTIGAAVVRAEAMGFSTAITIDFISGIPAQVVLQATPSIVDVGQTSTLRATVTDADAVPLEGVTVALSLTTNNSGASLSSTTATTDANGQASFTYTAGDVFAADTVQAVVSGQITDSVTLNVQAISMSMALTAAPSSLVVDAASGVKASDITAMVTYSSGEPVIGATLTFSVERLGDVIATRFEDSGTQGATAITDANGQATVTVLSGDTSGTVLLTAQLDTASATTSITVTDPTNMLTVIADPSTISGDGVSASTITALLTNTDHNPIVGATIDFSTDLGSISATGVTDSTGRATATLLSEVAQGIATVTAAYGPISATTSVSLQITTVIPDSLELLVSSPQLDSNGAETVTLTALVRNANNNFVADVDVHFAADSGGIEVTSGTTDATGTATALLSTAGDPTIRTITVTATAGTLVSTNTVQVTGTTITLSGASSLVLGETTTLSILLRDSGGDGIAHQEVAVSSEAGNTLSADTVTTDTNGQATVDITATLGGTDTIQATALGVSGSTTLTVSSANFVFIEPAAGTEVPLETDQRIRVHWDEAGVNQVGQTINFFATRGNLSATSAVTKDGGNATVTISSTNAGPAVITASDAAGGPSSQIEIEFVANAPASLVLQANPTSLGVNLEGSTDQQSIITAIVRDASGNLVKSQRVSFTLTDVSGGSIFPASAITDSFGRASTVYTAGAAVSAQDGVSIKAEVAGIVDQVTLTVAQQALFVTLGTSHLIQDKSDTQYAKPYSVLVTDANGSPVQGARVELNIYPTRYQKGYYALFFDPLTGDCTGWGKVPTVTPASALPNDDNDDQACDNEDVNRDGLLNPAEDINNNGTLEPGNVASAPASVTTDATGFALFDLVYAKEFTWVEVELEARATVAGSEAASTARFFLPGLASDFEDCDAAPPGVLSPYGQATTCGCDELADPTCPL
jgi:hypothetical protein